MKKFWIISIVLLIVVFLGIIWFVNNSNNTKDDTSSPDISRTSIQLNIENNTIVKSGIINKELSNYSTQIKDNSQGRLNNIRITCNTLNGTVVEPGSTFSFNDIVGKPTKEKGYMEAPVIIDHDLRNGIGGGNCQVSSTIYNAVLLVSQLQVIERHEHGLDVTYVPDGKDSAVSFGSLDLKFKNNLQNKIRIDITTDDKTITAKLIEISE